jgi:hypothetical protein
MTTWLAPTASSNGSGTNSNWDITDAEMNGTTGGGYYLRSTSGPSDANRVAVDLEASVTIGPSGANVPSGYTIGIAQNGGRRLT